MSFQLLFRNYLVYKLHICLTHKFKTCSVIVLIELWLGEKFSLYSCKPTHRLCVRLTLFCRFCLILDSFGIVCRIYIVPITRTYNDFLFYFIFFTKSCLSTTHIGNCNGTIVLEEFSIPLWQLTILPLVVPVPSAPLVWPFLQLHSKTDQ